MPSACLGYEDLGCPVCVFHFPVLSGTRHAYVCLSDLSNIYILISLYGSSIYVYFYNLTMYLS